MKGDKTAIAAARRKLAPGLRLVLLYGPDTAASRDLAHGIAAQFANAADPLAISQIAATTLASDPAALAAAASEVSMFGSGSLVRVDDAGEDALAAIEALLALPPGGNPVLMTAGTLKKGSKLVAAVERAADGLAYISYLPDARSSVALVAELAAEFGLQPSAAAARALADSSGGDRGILRRELEKLALYLDAGEGRTASLDIDAVTALSASYDDSDFGALVEAVAGRQPMLADRQLSQLAVQGIPGITLLRTVARRFWLLLELRQLVDGGSSTNSAVEAARPPVFWKDRPAVAAQLGEWRTPALRGMLARLLVTERAIKASGTAGDVLAAQLLVSVAASRPR